MFYSTRRSRVEQNINLSPNAKYCTIAQIKTISHLCCTTPRISTKLNTIDKNLVPWMSKISFFFPSWLNIASAQPKRNAYFIHKTISVREKIAQIHINTQRSYCDVMPLLRMVRNSTTVQWYAASQRLSSHRRVRNKLSRCCTTLDANECVMNNRFIHCKSGSSFMWLPSQCRIQHLE